MFNWHHQGYESEDGVRGGVRRTTIVAVDDSGVQQLLTLSGLKSEQLKKIVRILPHGFSSNPPVGSEGLIHQMGGRSDRAMGHGFEHPQYRQKNLPPGTAVLYDQQGNVIYAKGKNGIALDAQNGQVYVKPAQGQMVYLGGTGQDGTYDFVATCSGGCSINVKARIG